MSAEASADKPADGPVGTTADDKNANLISFVLSAGTKDASLASLASSAGSAAGMSADTKQANSVYFAPAADKSVVTPAATNVLPADTSSDGRWLTYDELAALRGIDRTSARRLTTRLKWPRRPGNDGTVRILVPVRHLRPPRRTADTPASTAADIATAPAVMPAVTNQTPADLSAVIVPLKTAIDVLREQLAAANAGAGQALVLADQLTGQLADAEARARDATEAARIATDALNVARRAEEARKARGRLRRTWDGWRGR
jgi:hypothetical protein